MKYGYLFFRKPLRPEIRERPINIGDVAQPIAAINLFREMGIPEEDIIPIDRYNTANYEGEEVILSVNCYEGYEHRCYPSNFLPFSSNIYPAFISLSLRRPATKEEVAYLKKHEPIGCRDEATLFFLEKHGIKAHVSGCISITLPRREENENQKKVFFIDMPSELLKFIPAELKKEAINLSQVVRLNSVSADNNITLEETESFHKMGYDRLLLLRDEAKLVVTSRLHVATPCLAMGIPVILAKSFFDVRFGFVDKFLPLYTPDRYNDIDWNPKPQDIEHEKAIVKEYFFSRIRERGYCQDSADKILQVDMMYKNRKYKALYSSGIDNILAKIPLPKDKPFRYAIWGVCLPGTFNLYDEISSCFVQAVLVNAIDTFATGDVLEVKIINPNQIANLPEDVIIFVTAPAAHKAAKELFKSTKRPFVLIKSNPEIYNLFDEK